MRRRNPASLAGGLQGLAGGVSSGVTGLVRAPLAGYGRGSSSGLALGLGRGLLGAVGLPLSGALDLVSSISAGLAATAGVSHQPVMRRSGRTLGEDFYQPSAHICVSVQLKARWGWGRVTKRTISSVEAPELCMFKTLQTLTPTESHRISIAAIS